MKAVMRDDFHMVAGMSAAGAAGRGRRPDGSNVPIAESQVHVSRT